MGGAGPLSVHATGDGAAGHIELSSFQGMPPGIEPLAPLDNCPGAPLEAWWPKIRVLMMFYIGLAPVKRGVNRIAVEVTGSPVFGDSGEDWELAAMDEPGQDGIADIKAKARRRELRRKVEQS